MAWINPFSMIGSTKQVSLATNPIIKLLFGMKRNLLVLGALTWSKDLNKGFEDYLKFDEALTNCSNVEIRFLSKATQYKV